MHVGSEGGSPTALRYFRVNSQDHGEHSKEGVALMLTDLPDTEI